MALNHRKPIAFFVATVAAAAGPAAAQISAPPRHDTRSPTGVSYRNGAFSWEETDLSIGGEEGLALSRTYLSSSQDGLLSPGWTHNFFSIVRNEPEPAPPDTIPPPTHLRAWVYHLVVGGSTYSFVGGGSYPNQGQPAGSYQSVEDNGASLVYTGTNSSGYYTLTLADGSVIVWSGGISSHITSWTRPDGTRLDYSYAGNRMIASNRGYAVIVEGNSKACVVNLSRTYVTAGSACPSGVPTVTYAYTTGAFTSAPLLASVTKADNRTTTYAYVGADHLGCIKPPGQTTCRISNTYAVCPEDPSDSATHFTWRYRDPVISQTTATSETYAYDYGGSVSYEPVCNAPVTDSSTSNNGWQFNDATVTMTTNTGARTVVGTSVAGTPTSIRDPLNRQTTMGYGSNGAFVFSPGSQLGSETLPEGNETDYAYDSRGNVTSTTMKAKPGSGLSNIVVSASYPAACSNPKTCNKPTSMTDARGAVTDFTYDSSHGGLLSEMAPAPASGGARPLKLFTYAQKYAYVLNSASALVPASTPVWVRATMIECQTAAGSSTPACDSAAPQRVTTYLYGADGTADNLLVHGIAVTADSQTLRTCYGYDTLARRISETRPRAGLTVCP